MFKAYFLTTLCSVRQTVVNHSDDRLLKTIVFNEEKTDKSTHTKGNHQQRFNTS